jgi:hypothetical protein
MKLILFAALIFTSLSSFAGDLYFVCENEVDNDFLSATIGDRGATLLLNITESQPVRLHLKRNKSSQSAQYDLEVNFLREKITEQFELKLFEEIKLGKYSCLVRD